MSSTTALPHGPCPTCGHHEVEDHWRAERVAQYLDASESWVRKATAAGRIPCRRIGGLVRYDPEEIRAWAAQRPADVIPLRR